MSAAASRVRPSRSLLAGLAALLASVAAAQAPQSDAVSHGLDLAGIDHSVKPGDDFFAYANGTWLKDTPIPADRSSWGVDAVLTELTSRRTAGLIQEAAARDAPPGSEVRKIGDYYSSFMDEASIEQKGLAPLEPLLERIRAIRDRNALAHFLGGTVRSDVDVLNNTELHTDNLFGVWIAADLEQPTRYVPFLLQGGLGMPDRDYYLDSSPRMATIREQYRAHIARVLDLAHIAEAQAAAQRIFDLEVKIARAHVSRADSESVEKGNNHWMRTQFPERAPGMNWETFFAGAELAHTPELIVWQPGAVTGISALVASEPLSTWKEYLLYHAVDHRAGYLPKAFVDEGFAFYGKVLTGTPQLRERWKRAVGATDAALGFAVGRLYVTRYFPMSEKQRAQALVRNLIAAMGVRIDRLSWMAPQTKEKAKAKLTTLKVGVGYPDHWQDYSALKVVRGDALGNFDRAELYHYQYDVARLGHPVDRDQWVMVPQLVNAVNLPVLNALNFPAAMLQPPYFDPQRPEVMDYGAIGAVIGHEISHSFDDQGALFDASGRLHNWWTPEDFAHFRASAERLAKQFDGYRPFPDLAVNGTQTLSEDIADLAGLNVAYDAYHRSIEGTAVPIVQGFTGDQQFFVSFAQSWREKDREAALRRLIITDGHAPSEYRPDTVRNLDAWYPAFDVQPGDKLYLSPEARVRIW